MRTTLLTQCVDWIRPHKWRAHYFGHIYYLERQIPMCSVRRRHPQRSTHSSWSLIGSLITLMKSIPGSVQLIQVLILSSSS